MAVEDPKVGIRRMGTYLCLWDEEIGVDERAGAKAAPDEKDRRAQVALRGINHVWRNDGDDLRQAHGG